MISILLMQVSNKVILGNSDIRENYEALIEKGYNLRFCNTRNDTDRCISPDGYPSRLETQTAMEKSNYTLLLPGDTAGSDRWSQAMVAGKCQSNTVCTLLSETLRIFFIGEKLQFLDIFCCASKRII